MPYPVDGTDLRAQPQTVRVLEVKADDHEIEFLIRKPQPGARRVDRLGQFELALQRFLDELEAGVLVLHHENPGRTGAVIEGA